MQGQRPRRKAYLDDFKPDAAGHYVYCRTTLAFCGTTEERRRFRFCFGLCCAVILAAEIAAGCLNVGTLSAALVIALVFIVAGAILIALLTAIWH